MRQRNTMKLWQMLVLAGLLLAVGISMFLPVISIRGTKLVEVSKKEFGLETMSKWANVEESELDKNLKEFVDGFDKIIEEGEEETGIHLSSLSGIGFILMDTNALVLGEDYTKEKLEKQEEDEDFVKFRGIIGRYKLLLAIVYFGAVVILALLLSGYFLKWSKYIMASISAGFGSIVSVIFAICRWGVPAKLIDSDLFNNTAGNLKDMYDAMGVTWFFDIEKTTELGIKAGWKGIMGLGVMTCFILGILLVVMGIITCIVGKAPAFPPIPPVPLVPPVPSPPEPVPVKPPKPKYGRVKCTQGVAMGQGFKLPEDRKVIIGKSPQNATLVIHDPHISNVHCSVRYRAETDSYIVKDHSTNGTFVHGVRLGKDVAMEYPAGTVLSLADGTNKVLLG